MSRQYPPAPLCRRLLKPAEAGARERWIAQAVLSPECMTFCLEEARNTLAAHPDQALPYAGLAAELADRRADYRSGAAAWRLQAQALRALGRHAEALDAFDAAAKSAQNVEDSLLAAQVRIGAIDSLGWLGRYDEAFALARQLERDLRTEGAEGEAAKVLVNAGNLHYRRDQYREALSCYERAMGSLSSLGDTLALARLQANSANILALLNRVDEGLALFDQARAIFAAQDLKTLVAMVDASAGYLRFLSGEHAAALALLMSARQEFAGRGQALETAKCDLDMAEVYRELNLFPEALECYTRTIPVFQSREIVYEAARAELGRASVLMTLQRQGEAFAALEAADGLFAQQKNALQRGLVRLMRAYMLRARGRMQTASEEALAAARTLAKQGSAVWAAAARFLAAETALDEGTDATRQMHGVVRVARRYAQRWLVCRAERALGRHYLRQGDIQKAIHHFRAGVEALEEARTLVANEDLHVAFLSDKLAIYEDLVDALLTRARRADLAEALECVERSKSRLLLERIQTSLDRRAPDVFGTGASGAPERARLSALRAELSRSYHQLQALEEGAPQRRVGSAPDLLDRIAPLERAYRAALHAQEMAGLAASPISFALSAPVPADRLCATLAADEMLVEYTIANGIVGAFVLSSDGLKVKRQVACLEEVAVAARRLRFQLNRVSLQAGYVQSHFTQMQSGIESALQELHTLLLAPLLPLLQTEQVVLVPHGPLHDLPFHAFYDGAEYALSRYEFLYAPSAAVWYAGVQRGRIREAGGRDCKRQTDLLVMGVPEPQIARVATEVEQIAGLFPDAQAFCGPSATVEAFRAHAGHCRRLHLATHALFRSDNPLFSCLRFADGWLLARDLYEIPLHCDLATLSACRTGTAFVASGDELFGLTRGFLSAGARSVAASLWPADDTATAALMERFYTLLAQGVSRAAALRAAQRATRAEYPHPYHWAAFALFGER
ncbi:MAG TPA: CHAT domain-containing protein [Chthonomonadaceae bacterium]|nr:CHAT domain-containing protein [Chthonomonadaceae bacterium]